MVSFLVLLTLMTMLFTGCSAIFRVVEIGEIVEKTYDFKDFTNVEFSGGYQYKVKQSDSYSVFVASHENLIKRLNIHQSGDTLYIGFKSNVYNEADTMVTVVMPKLEKLVVSGACKGSATGFNSTGDLEIKTYGDSELNMNIKAGKTGLDISGSSEITGDLTSADTQVELSGASHLNMSLKTSKTTITVSGDSEVTGDLQALAFQLTLSGASKCELNGSAGNTVIEASGSSEMNSKDLILQSADVKLTGASYADIYTDGTLDVNVSGASTLNYTGNPTIGKIEVSGVSKINHQ